MVAVNLLDLAVEFEATCKHLATPQRIQTGKRKQQPVFYLAFGTNQVPFIGLTVINVGGPAQGHFWYVRGLAIWNVNFGIGGSPSSGKSIAVVSATDYRYLFQPGNVGSPSLADLRTMVNGTDWRDTWPVTAYFPHQYSSGAFPVNQGECLQALCQDNDTNTFFACAAWIEDYQWGASEQAWTF